MKRPYQLDFSGLAKRQLKRVEPEYIRKEMANAVLDLQDEPYPPNSELDRELNDRYRLKIGGWRIIYKVNEQDKIVKVLTVRRRDSQTYLNVP
ncbi:type II toxin-antitoxin system RelE/ParE family toxin [Chloroflexi bacterium TSY]|nr:type II toxin-antitoxin system RelE/ParE family toxin [Chloroflexi bacterium TSY]